MIFFEVADKCSMSRKSEKLEQIVAELRSKRLVKGIELVERIEEELNSKKIKKGVLFKYAGINSQSLRNWLTQNSIPATETAIKIAECLNISVKYLITGEREKELSQAEHILLGVFKQLDSDQQDEVIQIAQIKLNKKIEKEKKKGDTLSNLGIA